MNFNLIAVMLFTSLTVFGGWAFGAAGNSTSGGADMLRVLVHDSRLKAASLVGDWSPLRESPWNTWIEAHRHDLVGDLLQAPHEWVLEATPTCAFTEFSARKSVRFSFETCRLQIQTYGDAVRLLIHESAHHLGIQNEADADAIAQHLASLSALDGAPCSDLTGVWTGSCSDPLSGQAEEETVTLRQSRCDALEITFNNESTDRYAIGGRILLAETPNFALASTNTKTFTANWTNDINTLQTQKSVDFQSRGLVHATHASNEWKIDRDSLELTKAVSETFHANGAPDSWSNTKRCNFRRTLRSMSAKTSS